jgi:2-C-methyl-D-erythritol 4-phosphate cytidylyltransferase/2-C-methyl-D-erythritol 2,4-cyclodiphosphate synthase
MEAARDTRPGGAEAATALIVAAGRGTRAGGGLAKQWRLVAGRPLIAHAFEALRRHPRVAQIVVVVRPEDEDRARAACPGAVLAPGGETRTESVRAGLAAASCPLVLIHDGARPCLGAEVIDRVLAALALGPAAAPAVAVTDALWRGGARVEGLAPREGLWRAQTPQGFRTEAIRSAHAAHPGPADDDVAVARAAGLDVAIVAGDEDNLKVTRGGDFARAARLLAARRGGEAPMRRAGPGGAGMDVRIGNGFDVHRFGPGDHVMLCGVAVPHGRGLQGHSDADVGMHAVTDAILGALAEGDIGRHFPPSEPRWKGAASEIFLARAVEIAAARGFAIGNVDCTLVCEAPKIGPHADAMRRCLAGHLGIEVGRVGVKATTSERLGFTGRGEGIAALASAVLVAS